MAVQKLQVKFSTDGVAQVQASSEKAKKSYTDFLASAEKAMKMAEQAAAAANGNVDKIAAAEKAKERAVLQSNRIIAASYKELQIKSSADIAQQKATAISAYEAIRKSGVASANDIGRAQQALTQKLQGLDRQLQTTKTQSHATAGGFTVLGGAVSTFAGNLALQGVQALIGGLQSLSAAVIDTGTKAERQQVAFETFFRSAEKAKSIRRELIDFAAKTPFEVPEVIESAKTLAAKGIAYEQIIPTIKRLGEIAAGADKPLSQLLFVYGQIKDQGRAFVQDINQLTNAGLSIADMAKTLGITTSEVKEFVSDGLFEFDDLQKVIIDATSEGGRFYGLMDKLGTTTAVKLSNVKDVFTKVYTSIYNGIAPALGAVLDIIVKVLNPLADNERLFDGINKQAAALKGYLEGNPAIVRELSSLLEGGVRSTLSSIAELAQQFVEYLKQNPTFIEDSATAFQDVLTVLGVLLRANNEFLAGVIKIIAVIHKWAEVLIDVVKIALGLKNETSTITALFKGGPEWLKPWGTWLDKFISQTVKWATALLPIKDIFEAISGLTGGSSNATSANTNQYGVTSPVVGATSANGGGYSSDTGLDILTPEGSKVVSPVSGKLVYAETGHVRQYDDVSPNSAGYQSPKSALIELDTPIQYQGKTIRYAYLTHLRGLDPSIEGRGADKGDPVKIKVGQPLGESGVANKVPHLHIGLTGDRAQTEFLTYQQVEEVLFSRMQKTGAVAGSGETEAPDPATSVPPSLTSKTAASKKKAKDKKATKPKSSKAEALIKAAQELGLDPVELGALISFESGGTFSPSKRGGDNDNYLGLIQFGPEAREETGANAEQSFEQQMRSVVLYFKQRGYKPGMGILKAYATVLGGNPSVTDSADSNGTTARNALPNFRPGSDHYKNAFKFLGGKAGLNNYDGSASYEAQFTERERAKKEALETARRVQDLRQQALSDDRKKSTEARGKQALQRFDIQTLEGSAKVPEKEREFYERDRASDRRIIEAKQAAAQRQEELLAAKSILEVERQRLEVDGKRSEAKVIQSRISTLNREVITNKGALDLDLKRFALEDAQRARQEKDTRDKIRAEEALKAAEKRSAQRQRQFEVPREREAVLGGLRQEIGQQQVDALSANGEDKKAAALAKQLELQRLAVDYDRQRLELALQIYAAYANGNQDGLDFLIEQSKLLDQINSGKVDEVNKKYNTLKTRIDGIAEGIAGAVTSNVSDAFTSLLDGSKTFGQAVLGALGGILKSVGQMFLQLALEIAQKAIFKQVAGLLGGLLGGGAIKGGPNINIGGGGGGVGIPGFATGGYTGRGGKYQPAGIVHANEYVIRSESVRRLGIERLDALNALPGYADGGLVSSLFDSFAPSTRLTPLGLGLVGSSRQQGRRGSNSTFVANINVTTPNPDGFRPSERQMGSAFADQVRRGTRR
jgi:hypothetical protein